MKNACNKTHSCFFSSIILLPLLVLSGCTTQETEATQSEFPQAGAWSSHYSEAPHIIYTEAGGLILWAEEEDAQMVLKSLRSTGQDLDSLVVRKGGYLPREFTVQLSSNTQQASVYPGVKTIFALSDIEGNFNTLVNLLQQHHIIDHQLNWRFGDGHLVVLGDVFDRGNHVTEMLWLLYRLEQQADQAGGHVHTLLGNHEAMNLRGDIRYIEPKYAEFARLVEAQFGLDYSDLYGDQSELGRWLRSKNVIEKIGDYLFVHAGLSPELARTGLSFDKINLFSKTLFEKEKAQFNATDSLLWGKQGPYWYRGYFEIDEKRWGPQATQSDVDQMLAQHQVETVIVGHTHVIMPEFRYGGRVCAIDVVPPADHIVATPPWKAYGILIKNGLFYLADENGRLKEMLAQAP
ncbi:MAG: hypothetical protein HOB84_07095 [Candidatus Marinimicrobia bacterium]|jgi:hypothetical protein|nr:hypothetical protein [Candidatus Neomarinimicrobiota bacterium]MBT4362477.1 hypothetical protein [Candidatus Neomarinimicrobiota bacterium]MBT4714520.1 hypothetical protein [Candidatus Neomarinimicrobiota bacterium]MBT4946559.1 hypothetical protein [Candidatus Neomarinimicrobiota bacterium]MBT5270362.1 hypothetical protein [Candidatus Neomarinimicrobiota bacterium]